MTSQTLDAIADAVSTKALPPVHLWNPSVTRDIDMRIARNGDWYYQGSLIQRDRMVKLFSTVLRVDDGETYLVTPQERLRIDVEDAPFIATLVEKRGTADEQTLVFTTNVDDKVIADADHLITVRYDQPDGEPSPYVEVRDSLYALINRSAYYELAEWVEQRDDQIGVVSSGIFMKLSDAGNSK